VYAANELSAGRLRLGDNGVKAGRLGRIEVKKSDVMLGAPFIFNKSNVDRFDF
jgi:hypothetical protein